MLVLSASAGAQGHKIYADTSEIKVTGVWSPDSVKYIPQFPWLGEYAQLPRYARWWAEVADCAGLKINLLELANVRFYEVNTRSEFAMLDTAGKIERWDSGKPIMYLGQTFWQTDQIVLPVGRILRPDDVKHEMLHIELLKAGRPHGHGDPGVTEAFAACKLSETAQESDFTTLPPE